jgi:hypothetical protein
VIEPRETSRFLPRSAHRNKLHYFSDVRRRVKRKALALEGVADHERSIRVLAGPKG